jgi:hypothetical protein
VTDYASLLDKRDAEDLALASLYRSFLALADAHHALTANQPESVTAAVNAVGDELQSIKELQSQINAQLVSKAQSP